MLPNHDPDARFRLAMNSAGIGMAIVSLDGHWLDVNPALCRMLGRTQDALVGRSAMEATHPDDLALSAEKLAQLLAPDAPPSLDFEKRYLRPDGEVVQVLINTAAMRDADGSAQYLISQFRDITAQRAMEAALHESHAMLERRVQARTAELEAANRRLESFVYGVSHDLRAPLRTIDGFARQLAQTGTDLDAQARDNVARIRGAVTRMGGLIDSLLELARIGRAELRPTTADISLLAEWCAAELQDAQPQRAADIDVQPGLEVIGDERLLKLMLGQLLRNAWQFAAADAPVRVRVEGERDGAMLHLRVRDEGIGFDMTYAGKLFEPFQRLHGSEQGAGDGIGLTIAQQVAIRHGGGIRAESRPGAGATFHVDLQDLTETTQG